MRQVYSDHIAGTPMRQEVLEVMLPYLKENFGNPQSFHSAGRKTSSAVEKAREHTARLINADTSEIIFTASGSEANNLAIKGLALANRKKGRHILVSAIEHQSVLKAVKSLEKLGFSVSIVPVNKWGVADPEEVKKAITSETIFVSIMLANSEVGTIEPVKDLAAVCRDSGVFMHTDAVAAVGNIPVDVRDLEVDALSLAADQFYGPRGSAALYIKRGTKLLPLIDGGIQEKGKRAGSQNVAGIVGLGKAAELAQNQMSSGMEKQTLLRDRLIDELQARIEHVALTGHPRNRLPYHASFCIEFVEGEAMLLNLDMEGIAVSSGSACTSDSLSASHVLLAMGLDHALAQSSLVFSLIRDNTKADIDHILEVFPPIVDKLRKMSPLYSEYLDNK